MTVAAAGELRAANAAERATVRMGPAASNLTNYVVYQLGWTGCVLSAAAGRPGLAAAAALAATGVHLALAVDRRREALLALVAGALGLAVDSVQLALGIFTFPSGALFGIFAPLWIVGMWMQFATTFHHCMGWLRGRILVSAAAGLLGGPLAFLAGERLGAIRFSEPRLLSFLLLGLFWAAALPALSAAADRLRPRGGRGYRSLSALGPSR